MSDAPKKPPTHRLHDMVVEEVSLVDRAANERRFLIVKRSDAVQEHEYLSPDGTPEDEDERSKPEEDAEAAGGTAPSSALSLATEALDVLSETVEALGTVLGDSSVPELDALGRELHRVAAGLEERVARHQPDSASSEPPSEKNDPEPGPPPESDWRAIRAALENISRRLEPGPEAPVTKNDDDNSPPRKGPGRPKSAGAPDLQTLSAKVDRILSELRTWSDALRSQQKRLSHVEKQCALPNSTPPGESSTRKRSRSRELDAEVGWPMDLNRSLDREHVDSSVSFHDV